MTQSTVTKDIARNIAEASARVIDANARVAETSQATAEIARDIAGIDQAAGQVAGGTEHVQSSVIDLSKVAEKLRTVVMRFRFGRVGRDILKCPLTTHAEWTTHLKTAIASGRLDTPIVTLRSDDQCQFGKWLYGEGLSDEEKHTDANW